MKESFVLYNSFYEPIKGLKNEQLGKLLRAIFNYTINGEITQEDDILVAFMFIKNQLDLDNEKYQKICERNRTNGKKGGRPKTQKNPKKPTGINENPKKPKKPDNDNDNDNEYDNDNDIYNSSSSYNNNIYEFVEKNFGRILTPIEIDKIDKWRLEFSQDIIEYAIQISVLNNKKTFNYVNGILNNWKSRGHKTLQEIKDEEFNKRDEVISKELLEIEDYDWLNDMEEE